MKIKLIALVCAVALAILLYACGADNQGNPGSEDTSKPPITTASAPQDAEPAKMFEYEHDNANDGICLTAYYGAEAVVAVPSTIDGLPVVGIGAECFIVGAVTEVYLPDTLIYFEWGLGYPDKPRDPEKLAVPYGVTKIVGVADPSNTWQTPLSHITEIIIPGTVTEIGEWAFMHCLALTSLAIPDSVVKIGQHAFYDCSSLKTVNLPENLAEIPGWAFAHCASLISISIPKSVVNIETSAFTGCYSLEAIAVDPGNSAYAGVGGVLFDKAITTLIMAPSALAGSYEAPHGISKIGDYAFRECGRLTGIIIPDSVAEIGEGAFGRCHSLKSVIIPDSVTAVGTCAFSECQSLEFVKLPKNITEIGGMTFFLCYSLAEILLPHSLTSIGPEAFASCKALTEIIIPDSVTALPDGAFYDCISLSTVIFGASLTQISADAFAGCVSLSPVAMERIYAVNPNCEFYYY